MPGFALAAYVAFILVAFGWRTWLHYRHTGESGFRGFSGAPGSLAWISGLLPLGMAASFLAPVLELAGLIAPAHSLNQPAVHAAGLVLLALGFTVTVVAQFHLGNSWRIGVDPGEVTPLVTHGIFRHVRNPIFSGMMAAVAGLVLLVPNWVALLGALAAVIGVEFQVRRVEEPYLLRTHGERYREYARTVGRFFPRLGLLSEKEM